MTKPTTEELKDLMSKSSRGPWIAAPDGVTFGATDVLSGDGEYVICEHAGDDATLIALAPTLAAEVVELREALEWLDDMLFEHGFSYDGLMRDRISQALDATSAK